VNTSLLKLFSIMLIASLMISSCSALSPAPTVNIQEQITQTMAAVATYAQSTLEAAVPTAEPATDTPAPTDTPAATDTPAPTDTPMPTDTPAPTNPPAPTRTPLPVIIPTTAVPTSAGPTFSLDYYRVEVCAPNWRPSIKIVNTGSTTLSSYTIALKDRDNTTNLTASSNDFSKINGCTVVKDISSLDKGETGFIYSPNLDYDPADHSMKATITVCYKDDLKGKCNTQVINFTP
jgi:hypothetical protein